MISRIGLGPSFRSIGHMDHPQLRRPPLTFPDANETSSAPDADALAWFEVDRIAMRHVFEDLRGIDQGRFKYRTWSTPWDRWSSPVVRSGPPWRRPWERVVALVRRVQSPIDISHKVLAG